MENKVVSVNRVAICAAQRKRGKRKIEKESFIYAEEAKEFCPLRVIAFRCKRVAPQNRERQSHN